MPVVSLMNITDDFRKQQIEYECLLVFKKQYEQKTAPIVWSGF